MWFDEVFSWHTSQNDIKQIVIITSGDIHPPLFYIVLKYWTSSFGDSVIAMRMLSVILNLLTAVFLLKICTQLRLDDRQKLFALFLYAITPLNIYYSQEIRMQALSLFLTCGSVYYFIRAIDKCSFRISIGYIIFTFLSFYTHYFTFLIFGAQILYAGYIYFRKEINSKLLFRLSANFFIPAILFIPWINVLIDQVSKGQPWRKQQDFFQVFVEFLKYFNDFIFSTYHNFAALWTEIIIYTFSILLIISVLYFIIKLFKVEHIKKNFHHKLLAFLIALPLIFAFLLSFRQSIIFSRYLSTLVPYLCILISIMIYRISSTKKRDAAIVLLSLMFISGLYNNSYNSWKYNDYRGIISYIKDNDSSSDYSLITDPHYLGWVIKYESLHSDNSIKKSDVFGWDLPMQFDSLRKRSDIRNLWVVLDYSSMDKNGYDELESDLGILGFKAVKEKYFYIYPEKVKAAYYVRK